MGAVIGVLEARVEEFLCLPSHAVLPERVSIRTVIMREVLTRLPRIHLCALLDSPTELLCAMPLMCVKSRGQ